MAPVAVRNVRQREVWSSLSVCRVARRAAPVVTLGCAANIAAADHAGFPRQQQVNDVEP
jgi:hypothetical protein